MKKRAKMKPLPLTAGIVVLLLVVAAAGWFAITAPQKNRALKDLLRDSPPGSIDLGERLYTENCAVCHNTRGTGAENWHLRLADGSLRPPPLNGSAHTWHHPSAFIKARIKHGGAPAGGNMPAFGGKLNDEEIYAVILYIVRLWPDEVRQVWETQVENR